jgi:GT2 family glycosyltransferase
MPRPSATVVVPFKGPDRELGDLVARMATLRTRPGDHVVVVDNRPGPADGTAAERHGVLVLRDGAVRSAYHARNAGARAAPDAEWLVFLDTDVRFDPDLLDRLLDPPPADDVGVLAGGVTDTVVTDTAVARALVRRRQMDQRVVTDRARPYAQTAHCAVRRAAFDAAGGFVPGVRSGGDADLCLRLADAGWRLESRHEVAVRHAARATLGAALRQVARHGAGAAWVERRHPGALPARRPLGLLAWGAGRLCAAAVRRARGDRDGAWDAALDALLTWAFEAGRLLPARAGSR